MKEPVMELEEGDFNVKEFADLMFEMWMEDQPIMNIEDDKVREIYDTGFAICRKFFEEAAIPALVDEMRC